MKYFIAHLLSGSSKAYHTSVTRVLSERFRIFPLHERVVPHITVKTPFEATDDEILEVERVLRSFSKQENAAPLTLKGFGRFGFRTVYMDVAESPGAVSLVRRMLAALKMHAPFLPSVPNEGNKLHASVARFLTRQEKRRISRFLKDERPLFQTQFDNVAILKKEGKQWKVMTTIPLSAPEPEFAEDFSAEAPSLVYST